mgnify:CR=1 FL=1
MLLTEEKARGLSILPGFACLDTAAGRVEFVDCPGHERFVRTMVAGAMNQRLTSIIGHGVPPGQNMIAIITPPMASDASAWNSSSK